MDDRGVIPGSASDVGSEEPRIVVELPRAVFVLHRLGLRTGGLTKAWLDGSGCSRLRAGRSTWP